MAKYKYVAEFEFKAGVKMLFPYVSNPGNLQEWLADEVNIDEDKIFEFNWDYDNKKAKVTSKRTNSHIKFQFLPENEEDSQDPSYLEFKLVHNEMTNTSFLKVIDYSEMDDPEELDELWSGLISQLKEILGG